MGVERKFSITWEKKSIVLVMIMLKVASSPGRSSCDLIWRSPLCSFLSPTIEHSGHMTDDSRLKSDIERAHSSFLIPQKPLPLPSPSPCSLHSFMPSHLTLIALALALTLTLTLVFTLALFLILVYALSLDSRRSCSLEGKKSNLLIFLTASIYV